MEDNMRANLEIQGVSPEVKAYIYQMLSEFEPFITPQTLVAVIAKDPLKLLMDDAAEAEHPTEKEALKTYYRISISLMEDGSKIEEEGLDKDIFTAIRKAKDKMVKTLSEIQDQVISNQDRRAQINSIRQGGGLH